jgi:Fe-S cluster biogenesis protein NfuA
MVAAVTAEIERSVAPTIIARGGMVRVVAVDQGMVTLEASGSPGAFLPANALINTLLCKAVPGVRGVRVVWPGEAPCDPVAVGDLATRVQTILDAEINPAVAAHRGRVSLVAVTDGRVQLRLEGGCQGCNLAQVTLRQGIEPMLRERLADVVSVIDVTNHAEGGEPFYSPAKR